MLVEAAARHGPVLDIAVERLEMRGDPVPVVERGLHRGRDVVRRAVAREILRDDDELAVATVLEAGEFHVGLGLLGGIGLVVGVGALERGQGEARGLDAGRGADARTGRSRACARCRAAGAARSRTGRGGRRSGNRRCPECASFASTGSSVRASQWRYHSSVWSSLSPYSPRRYWRTCRLLSAWISVAIA